MGVEVGSEGNASSSHPPPQPSPARGEGEANPPRKPQILFWVASRGHHADIGGISPGSMSPNATTIEEEGVYIDNFKLVDRGRFREQESCTTCSPAPHIRRAIHCRTSTT